MSSEAVSKTLDLSSFQKILIVSAFSKEEVGLENSATTLKRKSSYRIAPHKGFEEVELSHDGEIAKLAYK